MLHQNFREISKWRNALLSVSRIDSIVNRRICTKDKEYGNRKWIQMWNGFGNGQRLDCVCSRHTHAWIRCGTQANYAGVPLCIAIWDGTDGWRWCGWCKAIRWRETPIEYEQIGYYFVFVVAMRSTCPWSAICRISIFHKWTHRDKSFPPKIKTLYLSHVGKCK